MVCKNYLFFNKKGYIKENIKLTMNLKERGITVGDLLVMLIIILSSTLLFKVFNNNKETKINLNIQENISFQGKLLSINYIKNISLK